MDAALYFTLVLNILSGALMADGMIQPEMGNMPTACKVDILKQLDSCTDSAGNKFEGGSLVVVVKGTICVHDVCGVLRLVECGNDGHWIGQGGIVVTDDFQHECRDEEFTNNHDEHVLHRIERGFRTRFRVRLRRRRRSPAPPPVAQCGQPGNVNAATIHVTKTSQGGVATYTCIQHYIHTAGDLTRTCQSNSQWSGTAPTCAYMNTCSSSPCVNGGTCTNVPDSFTCMCAPIWKGTRCEIDTNECESTTLNKCSHICSNTYGSYTCSCNPGDRLLADRITCQDIDECAEQTAGCQHTCTNTDGSFTCSCRSGFQLSSDEQSCQDINECSQGTSGCEYTCTNNVGSFVCSCITGHQLDINGKSCSDVDECTDGTAQCGVYCTNTVGSYRCSCQSGYRVVADGRTCEDENECNTANGGCDQVCMNEPGTYSCDCEHGYRLSSDSKTCSDIEECTEGIDGCSDQCQNTQGSFTCSCNTGFELQTNQKTCTDIDDCEGIICQHGGTCRDGLNLYSCTCAVGYTSANCETDINECEIYNGRCQDACINTDGSYHCGCYDGRELQSDGFTCPGGSTDTVFERFEISGGRLPQACFVLPVAYCTDGNDILMQLTSTSEWYSLISNPATSYTFGIVFVKVNRLSLPISIQGIEAIVSAGECRVNYGTVYNTSDGSLIQNDETPPDCKSFELVQSDIFDFISSESFLATYLDGLFPALPDWISFEKSRDSLLAIQDLKTDLVYGKDMEHTPWCEGAPVRKDHLYSVFRFDSTFSLRVLGDEISVPKPLGGNKFCFIIDLWHSNGGSIFLMVPEESRHLLESINVFKQLKLNDNLEIHPRGIGISSVNGINVHMNTSELELWNGDAMFKYPVFHEADLWIGADVSKYDPNLLINATADIFIGVPSIDTMLTSIFLDEWNGLVQMSMSISPTLMFKLFGKEYSVTFNSLITAELNVYLSIGGSDRLSCGEMSNPAGLFFSFLLEINPFKNVPMLEDWGISNNHIVYGFATYDPPVAIGIIDIVTDVLDFNNTLQEIRDLLSHQLQTLGLIFRNTTLTLVADIEQNIALLQTLLDHVFNNIESVNWDDIRHILEQLWQTIVEMKQKSELFFDDTEFIVEETFRGLAHILQDKIDGIKDNIGKALNKVTNSLIGSSNLITGFGLKYTVNIKLIGLNIGEFDLEVVYSSARLLQCSRFEQVRKHFEGEEALRFIGRGSQEKKLNLFLKYERGVGIGGALSSDKDKFFVQFQVFVGFLGLKVTADLFVTNNGIYSYIEGNIWGIFLAQVDISSEMASDWYKMTYKIQGRLVAKSRKRRQIQTEHSSFQNSYLDALKKVINTVADFAKQRLSQAQQVLSNAQSSLSKAQTWLEDKKTNVRNANVIFDNAIASLERAKDKLEAAKEPFQEALSKLSAAQRKVDNLCRIKTCGKKCIPGVKCRICNKKKWRIRIYYPCCRLTSCMFSIPNPICVAGNLACRAIRAVAYLVLQGAKIFVRVPMLAFDVAKGAVSLVQVTVDKSRVVLDVAEGFLEMAIISLEYLKGVLEVAKIVLDGVKLAVGAAVHVLEFVIDVGLKNIIDVRNCGFNVELSTYDLPIFDIFCDVNAFRLGWKTITIRINFKNVIQSIWNAARATIHLLMKQIIGIDRRRREVVFRASSKMHSLLRKIRQSEWLNETISSFNESIDLTNDILGFADNADTDYESRILIFKEKCKTTSNVMAFLNEVFDHLRNIVNESKQDIDQMSALKLELQKYTLDGLADNMTLENAGISLEYAVGVYNMTDDDLQASMNESKRALLHDPLLLEINATINIAIENLNAQLESVESIDFLAMWLATMTNVTSDYFKETECIGINDCVIFAVATLYEVYEAEDLPDINNIREVILDLETVSIELFQNDTSLISDLSAAIAHIVSYITYLDNINPFCSEAPVFSSELKNQTVLNGTDVMFTCDVSGNPYPRLQWLKGDIFLPDATVSVLQIRNATVADSGIYSCNAVNVVANFTSNVGYLQVVTYDDNECETDNGMCGHLCTNVVSSYVCSCFHGYTLNTDGTKCSDIDECLTGESDCQQDCFNSDGSYACGCKHGFVLDVNGRSCNEDNGIITYAIVLALLLPVLAAAVIGVLACVIHTHIRRKVVPTKDGIMVINVKPCSDKEVVENAMGPSKPVFNKFLVPKTMKK